MDTITAIQHSQIHPGDNDRVDFNAAELQALAESIAEHGLAQPITVRLRPDGGYSIVAGERRWRACRLAGVDYVPSIVRDLTDEEADSIMLFENIHRADLNPLEEGRAYHKRMSRYNLTAAEFAKKENLSANRVTKRVALLDLIPDAQKLLSQKQLSLRYAEIMCPVSEPALDANRQRIAMRFLAEKTNPSPNEFKMLVAKLRQDQAQEAMFSLNDFMVALQPGGDLEGGFTRTWPVDDSLPIMPRKKTVAAAFDAYIVELQNLGRADAALVVGRVYESFVKSGWIAAPAG